MALPPGLRGRRRGGFDAALAFDDLDVLIDRRVDELVHLAAGPFDLDAVNLGSLAGAQNFSRVVRRQKTAPGGFKTRTLPAARRPSDDRPDRVGIALFCHELKAEPVGL